MLKRPIPKRPAPKLSMKSPNARPASVLSTVESPASRLSYTMDDILPSADAIVPSVSNSRDSGGSDDFASPFVIRRDTPQQTPEAIKNETPASEELNTLEQEEPTKEDGSTIAKYVDRFRRTQPLSRVERARSGLQARPAEFWWTDAHQHRGGDKEMMKKSKMKSEIGVAFKSPFGTSQPSRAKKTVKDAPRSLIPRPMRRELEAAAEEEWDSNGSSCPAVSTDGLDSNLSSNDTGVLRPVIDLSGISEGEAQEEEEEEDLTFRPQFLKGPSHVPPASSTSPPVRLLDSSHDDILARWRLKNQMELAREKARLQNDSVSSAASPARHHFKRTVPVFTAASPSPPPPPPPVLAPPAFSTPVQPERQREWKPALLDAGTQMPTPRDSHPVIADAEVQTSRPPTPCRCHRESKRQRKEKRKKKEKKEKGKEKEKEKETAAAAVIGDVVACGLGFENSLRSSVNSMFGPDNSLRLSTDRIPSTTARSESVQPSPTLEELVALHEEKAERFPDDTIVRQLRYQLHTKLEQIALIDEELRARNQL